VTGHGVLPRWIAGLTALGNPLTWVAPVAYLLVPGIPGWVRLLILGLGFLSVALGVIRRSVDPSAPTFELTWLTWKWMLALVLLTSILSGVARGSSADAGVNVKAAPVAVTPARVYDLSEVSVQPALLNREHVARGLSSSYPPLLRDAGVTGTVTLAFRIDTLGVPDNASIWVESTTHEAFTTAAITVVTRMRFRPATKDGRPVPVRVTLPVTFALQ
jgi:TonB family protein